MPARQQGNRWVTLPDGTKVKNPGGTGGIPTDTDAASLEQLQGEGVVVPEPLIVSDVKYPTPRTQAAANAQARERGLEFPAGVKTVKAKAAFLAGA